MERAMKKILLFNTAIGSQNMGDYIIVNCAKQEIQDLLQKNFVVEYTTHLPNAHFYQQCKKSPVIVYSDEADFKFGLGTNLLVYNLFTPWPNFNVNWFNSRVYENLILMGAGVAPNAKQMNYYTRKLYKKILSKSFVHSTRDERTKEELVKLGYKAINTGCVTMWKLTPEFCKSIVGAKAEKVIFTLTDYCIDRKKDQELINILKQNYKKVYFWVQGSKDLDYLKTLTYFNYIAIYLE